jgi:DNA-directed RNA polymerase subunit beta
VRNRVSFAKLEEVLALPDLVAIQKESFDQLLNEGIKEVLDEVSPIEDFTEQFQLYFGRHEFRDQKFSEEECRDKDITFSRPLFVEATFVNKVTGEIKEQEVFMGDFPMMTSRGTFIINGTERVVVSQLVRSPGVYFSQEPDKTSDKDLYVAKIIPGRGAWLEFDVDKKDTVGVRIDRKRRQFVTTFLKALGWGTDEILKLFDNAASIQATLEKDHVETQQEALEDIYRKLRPGEPPTAESAKTLLENLFFNPKRYDLAKVGRHKLDKKLGAAEGELAKQLRAHYKAAGELDNPDKKAWEQFKVRVMSTPSKDEAAGPHKYKGTLTYEDLLKTVLYVVNLHAGVDGFDADDIDHFGNRRLRSVGELIQNQIRIGLSRMERVVRERMTTQDVEAITPQTLINIRPVVASIKEFFGTSQLSQFMDQTNTLSGLTHKRRLSALGPGGLSRERAGLEVRDVHASHYGRMCPIETPEGPNIGLIGALSSYARINEFGFIESPYRRVENGKVTGKIDYLSADEEDRHVIAQANTAYDPTTGAISGGSVLVRRKAGEVDSVPPEEVDYMDVSPKQMVSIAAALIPFLEHDDANRALMGANMQKQAVPLLRSEAPLVGTGVEFRAAVDAGDVVIAQENGVVDDVSADQIVVKDARGQLHPYELIKFRRSNQGTNVHQKPIVAAGDKVQKGQVIADGPSTEAGEIALGKNLVVAYMPWEGHNYEDAIILSERLVKDDVLTSIHIEEHEVDARDTKLGAEEITRDIPNVSEEILKDLDERGIVRIGAEVNPGDYLVGKVTPKGETELTPEERLLRAIFGEKAREVRDTSLKVPHGEQGKVIGVRVFNRDDGDELPPGVNQLVRVYVAQKRKISDGDKLAGRHGNKGVISTILPEEDMPFLADGTPVDIILNPMGVPSRMNLGQVLEAHLGLAALWGFSKDGDDHQGPAHVATPVFDGAREHEILNAIRSVHTNRDGARLVDEVGKAILFDGRSGEPYEEPVTVGVSYILKLLHLVDDKIHARSTGPYSMITQQPLGGKAQFGGQRFGEMEVWALEAYGAAYALQELLTIKSDDVLGRVKVYEAIVKGENIPEPGIPESFKVLIKEMQSLCLNVEVRSSSGEEIELRETDEDVFRAAEELGIDLSRREPAGADFD